MAQQLTPPEPIRTDLTNPFANHSMRVRVPAILNEVIELNPDYPASILRDLIAFQESVANGDPIPPLDVKTAPDYDGWMNALEQQQVIVDGFLTWHNSEWFFAETYSYRYLMQIVRWYETYRDPFQPKKQTELDGTMLWDLLGRSLEVEGSPEEKLLAYIAADLWGNRMDLSYNTAMAHGTDTADDDLLIDNRSQLLEHLYECSADKQSIRSDGDIYLILDNAGTELVMDLVLVDFLLEHVTNSVVLQVKAHPTFVSDAIPRDIWHTLNTMRQKEGKFADLADRLFTAWNEQRLRLVPHLFWNSSLFLWDMPMNLRNAFDSALLVILKGDANYRRAVGDGLWQTDMPFPQVMNYLTAPVLCLRTLKSDPLVGLPSLDIEQGLNQTDSNWRTNGKRGVIQFKPYLSSNSQ